VAARYSAKVHIELETLPAHPENAYRPSWLSLKPSPFRINQALILRHGERKIEKEALWIIRSEFSLDNFQTI
jgi:hypothetical protein